eukprot:3937581-Rhodomonas_salina.1
MCYCRDCKQLLPLDKFPAVRDRFTCNACWSRTARTNKLTRYARDPYEYDGEYMRQIVYLDSMIHFGLKGTTLRVRDTKSLCVKLKISFRDYNIVPRDPRQLVTLQNMAIISKDAKRYLIPLWKSGKLSFEEYSDELARIERIENLNEFDDCNRKTCTPPPRLTTC